MRESIRDAVREAMTGPDADPAVLLGDVPAAVYRRPIGSDLKTPSDAEKVLS